MKTKISETARLLREMQAALGKIDAGDPNTAYYAAGACDALIRMALAELEAK